MGSCLPKSRKCSFQVNKEAEPGTPDPSESPPADQITPGDELHYATVDFGASQSKKKIVRTESTEYIMISDSAGMEKTEEHDQSPLADQIAPGDELHYATINFGAGQSKKKIVRTESTEYIMIRTDSDNVEKTEEHHQACLTEVGDPLQGQLPTQEPPDDEFLPTTELHNANDVCGFTASDSFMEITDFTATDSDGKADNPDHAGECKE